MEEEISEWEVGGKEGNEETDGEREKEKRQRERERKRRQREREIKKERVGRGRRSPMQFTQDVRRNGKKEIK